MNVQGGNGGFMKKYATEITGVIILIALVALGLSIAAFATKCNFKDGFGDTDCQGHSGSAGEGDSCFPITEHGSPCNRSYAHDQICANPYTCDTHNEICVDKGSVQNCKDYPTQCGGGGGGGGGTDQGADIYENCCPPLSEWHYPFKCTYPKCKKGASCRRNPKCDQTTDPGCYMCQPGGGGHGGGGHGGGGYGGNVVPGEGSLENFGNLVGGEGGGADCAQQSDWGTPQDPWFNGGGIEAGSPWQGQKNEPVIDCAEACGAAKGCTMFKSNGTYCGTWFKDGPSATAACAWAKAGDQCDATSIATPTEADWTTFQKDPAFGPQDLNSACTGTQCSGIPVKDGQCAPVWSPPSS